MGFLETLEQKGLLNSEILEAADETVRNLDPDRDFALAVANAQVKVILGYFFHPVDRWVSHLEQAERDNRMQLVRSSAYRLIKYRSPEARKAPLITMYLPETDVPVLHEATPYAGYFDVFPDPDGVVRWMPLVLRCADRLFPPLSIKTVEAYLGGTPSKVTISSYGVERLELGDTAIPVDELGRMIVPYPGPQGEFPRVSLVDVLEGAPHISLKDKIVLVGATAAGLYDLRVTPFSSVTPGLEIHASVIDGILSKDFFFRPEWLSLFDMLLILLIGPGFALLLCRLNAVGGAVCGAAFLGGYTASALYAFSSGGIILSVVYPSINLGLVYSTLTVVRYFQEEKERRKVRNAFGYYLSSAVVNENTERPVQVETGRRKKKADGALFGHQGVHIPERTNHPGRISAAPESLLDSHDPDRVQVPGNPGQIHR